MKIGSVVGTIHKRRSGVQRHSTDRLGEEKGGTRKGVTGWADGRMGEWAGKRICDAGEEELPPRLIEYSPSQKGGTSPVSGRRGKKKLSREA